MRHKNHQISKMEASRTETQQSNGDLQPSYARALIGRPPNYWLWSSSPPTFDLTRPPPPDFPVPPPSASIKLPTTTTPILVNPNKSALIVIDMQNFFLSPSLGRSATGAGNMAAKALLNYAIPAARKAGIRIIWLNWGLTDEEVDEIPPSTRRAFGFEAALEREAKEKALPALDPHGVNQVAAEYYMANKDGESKPEDMTENGKPKRIYKGLGSEIGPVKLDDGRVVDAGRLLMRHTWNAGLTPELDAEYQKGLKLKDRPDVWIHKNRMSGLWGITTPCQEFLEQEGIRTLFFAGVNTDQCVGGTLQDAFSKGWDCIMLTDGCGTTSPGFAKESIEFNCARTWGFVSSCGDLREAVENMLAVGK